MKMKAGKIFLLLLCLNVITVGVVKKLAFVFCSLHLFFFWINITALYLYFCKFIILFWVGSSCLQIANPPTCDANLGEDCGDSSEWQGEFFPGIPKIKYEVGRVMDLMVHLWCLTIIHFSFYHVISCVSIKIQVQENFIFSMTVKLSVLNLCEL